MGTSNVSFNETSILRVAADLIAARCPFALAIVIDAQGSTSARTGAKAIFNAEGKVLAGWVGGGCAESTIAHAAVECLETEKPQIIEVDLDDEVLGAGMPCGGRMEVYVEPTIPPPTIWILGHGRVTEALCHLGAMMSFNVTVNDVMASPERYPEARCVLTDDANYSALSPAPSDFVVVATQHRGDHESLCRLLKSDAGYIALIASRKRTDLVIAYLRQAGFDQRAVNRIRAPAGVEIEARTAEEIALSVISEIVLVHRSCAKRRESEGTARAKRDAARVPATLPMSGHHTLRSISDGRRNEG